MSLDLHFHPEKNYTDFQNLIKNLSFQKPTINSFGFWKSEEYLLIACIAVARAAPELFDEIDNVGDAVPLASC